MKVSPHLAGLVSVAFCCGCASAQAPVWHAKDVRPLVAAPVAAPVHFDADPPPSDEDASEFEVDYVPERDVAVAELSQRIDAAARELDALAQVAGTNGDASPLALARAELARARLTEETLRTAPQGEWKRARSLAQAAIGALEQRVAAIRAPGSA